MVKMHNIEQYLKDGITDNIEECQDPIEVKFTNETQNSFDVEFIDLSSSGDISRYRVIIEHLD